MWFYSFAVLTSGSGNFFSLQWGEESIESSSLVPSETVCLPSPKRRKVSPLTKMEEKKFARRRKVKRWSLQDEDTLRKAVEKYALPCLDEHHYTRLRD